MIRWLRVLVLVAATVASFGCGAPKTSPGEPDAPEADAGSLPPDAGPQVGSVEVLPSPDIICLFGCLNMVAGTTRPFVATVKDTEGNVLPDAPVTWETQDPSILVVSPDGVVAAKKAGEAWLRATSGMVGGEVVITVAPARVAKITVTPNPTTVAAGAQVQLTAVAEGDDGSVLDDVVFDWSSSNPLVAKVDENGLVTGISRGHAVILATTPRGFGSDGWSAIEVTSSTPRPTGFALTDISLGSHHGCGLTASGAAWCWGWNYFGQLGVNRLDTSTSSFPVPEAVSSTETFSRVELGALQSCALTATGKAWCWGANDMGQLGTHATIGEVGGTTVPYEVLGGLLFNQLSTGSSHTCGIATDGKMYCWGMGSDGALGLGDRNHRPTPTEVPTNVEFASVVAGMYSTCGLDKVGKAYCWGRNSQGQLGLLLAPSDLNVRDTPFPVVGNHAFTQLALTASHVCGLDVMGAAWCWGNNTFGQLGDGTTELRSQPVAVATSERFVRLTTGAHHSCGLQADGDVWCWGNNDSGQLGNGTLAQHETPVKVIGGESFQKIESAANVNCGVTTSGEALCWGSAYTGESAGGISGGNFVAPWPVAHPAN